MDPSTLDSIIFLQMNRDLWNGHLVEEIIVNEKKRSRAEALQRAELLPVPVDNEDRT
jgi:hypothetical protein